MFEIRTLSLYRVTMITVTVVTVTRIIDIDNLRKIKPPILFYGRRKTGKTFLVKNFYKNAEYFFVKRNRTIFWENKKTTLNYEELTKIIDILLKDKLVIIDEFHRLPEDFLDYLHFKQPSNIILITSTLHLVKSLLTKKSPILGLFLEYRVDLIDERDILANLSKLFSGKELIEKSVFLREPILLQWAELDLVDVLEKLKLTVPALVGEIFIEEERELSERYEGILRAVASGKQTISEITNYLYARKLISRQSPSLVKSYVKNLLSIGLLKRYKEYKREKYYYFVDSPIVDLYFYLDEKYNFSETKLSREYFLEKIPFYVEDFFRNLFAKLTEYRIFVMRKPELEVDAILGKFQQAKVVIEVKWRKGLSRSEVVKIEEKLSKFKGVKKVLIVPDKSEVEYTPAKIEVMDINDILEEILKYYSGH
ncbi:MAG: hypothetical protein DRJ63_08970 [Thermoprotei archaeon]|nr:MAG: hypothetical protein DRJ63_08970 [Thermoprotei archaeon]